LSAKNILLAVVPRADLRLRRVLAGHPLRSVQTIDQATRALHDEEYALVIIGVYFDQSRMFELLSYTRASALNRATPVVCVLGVPSRFTELTLRGLERTVMAMNAQAFVNLNDFADDPAGNAALRSTLERHHAHAVAFGHA
jgi:DNA-binding NtrC family response regulator